MKILLRRQRSYLRVNLAYKSFKTDTLTHGIFICPLLKEGFGLRPIHFQHLRDCCTELRVRRVEVILHCMQHGKPSDIGVVSLTCSNTVWFTSICSETRFVEIWFLNENQIRNGLHHLIDIGDIRVPKTNITQQRFTKHRAVWYSYKCECCKYEYYSYRTHDG